MKSEFGFFCTIQKGENMRLKRWVKVVITLIVIHVSFFIWKQTGTLGNLAQKDNFYLVMCVLSWFVLIVGQVLIYEKIWK